MSDQTPEQPKNASENAEQPAGDTNPRTDTDNAGEAQETGNAEAAKYRRRLRETEAELERVRAERDALQTSIAEDKTRRAREAVSAALSQHLTDDAVETVLETLDTAKVTDDQGNPDPEAVERLAARFQPKHPDRTGWSSKLSSGVERGGVRTSPSWADALQGRS